MKIKRRKKKVSKKVKAYCMKCKESRIMRNPKRVVMKNKRVAAKGTCPVCGTGMFRIGG